MTINFSAISTSIVKTGVASGTNGTATLVLGGSDTLVVLFIEASLQGGQADSGIVTAGSSFTVGGVALTHVPSALSHAGTSNHGFVDLYWGLTTNAGGSIPTGSQTVSVTINHTGSPGATGNWLVYACSYTGTPQSGGEIGTACKDSDDAASSETLSDGTVTASDLLVGVCCNGSTAPTVTTGQSRGTVNGDTSTSLTTLPTLTTTATP